MSKLRNRNLLIILSIVSISGLGLLYRTYEQEKREPLKAIKAYETGNCKPAIDHSNNALKSRRFFDKFNNYSDIVKNIKKECSAYLENTKEATLKIEKQDYVGALIEYDNFLVKHKDSSLNQFIPNSIKNIFSQSSPEKVASTEVCSQVYDVRENGTISNPNIILSLFHWHCGEQSYQRVECKPAIQHVDKIIGLETFSSYFNKGQSIKEECEVFIVKKKEAVEFEKINKLGEALVTYDEFLTVDHVDDQGPLALSTRKSAEQLFAKNGPAKLASSVSCSKTDSFISNRIIPNQDSNLPHLYWSCSKLYIANGQYSKEIDTHVSFLNQYSKHELSLKVQSAILKNFVACDRHKELQENNVIAKLPNLMPAVYLSCGKAYQAIVNYPRAIEFFGKVHDYYPNHSLSNKATEYVVNLGQEMKTIKEEMLIATNIIHNRMIACSAGNIFLGAWIDIGELISGKDCMTGQELNTFNQALNIIPLGDVFKEGAKVKKLIKLAQTIEMTLSIKDYYDLKNTQSLLKNNESFFALLNDSKTIKLLAMHNSNLTKLILNRRGKSIDLRPQHNASVKLLAF